MTSEGSESVYCLVCGGKGALREDGDFLTTCTNCNTVVSGPGKYSVRGANAKEVTDVIAELERHRLANRGPWRAGLFYLLCLVVVTTLFLAVARLVPAWILPVVIVAALIGVIVLGALQLRQDGRVSEKGMLSLIQAALRNARSLGGGQPPGGGPPPAV